jgi:hypothetical protein
MIIIYKREKFSVNFLVDWNKNLEEGGATQVLFFSYNLGHNRSKTEAKNGQNFDKKVIKSEFNLSRWLDVPDLEYRKIDEM